MKEIKKRFALKLDLQLFAEEPPVVPPVTPPVEPPKTHTQADIDKAVQDRLPRAEKAAKLALAKELGYDSVEAMTAAIKPKEKPIVPTDPVDVEKRVKELLEAGQKEQSEKTLKRILSAEVKVLANELGFADWEDAHALADLSKVTEDDKGNLTGVKEALEELLKKKPHLGKQKPGSGGFGAAVPNSQEQKKTSLENIKKMAQTEGTHVVAANDPWARK
jgi:hypothetical protein